MENINNSFVLTDIYSFQEQSTLPYIKLVIKKSLLLERVGT